MRAKEGEGLSKVSVGIPVLKHKAFTFRQTRGAYICMHVHAHTIHTHAHTHTRFLVATAYSRPVPVF